MEKLWQLEPAGFSDDQAGLNAGLGSESPRHRRCVVSDAKAAVGAEKNDASVPPEAIEQIGNGFARGKLRGRAVGYAIGRPLSQDQLHDRFTPAGEGHGGGQIVGVTTAANE